VTFDPFAVVIVPFPFTDRAQRKRRPALVLSAPAFNSAVGNSVMAMITSAGNAPWKLDVPIGDIKSAGLPAPSLVRMKLFTLDHRFVLRKAGMLGKADQRAVTAALRQLFPPLR
jgi:mRNA interferase MazF